ncbi:hypothetical protein WN944_021286 [Citrus x changshan-huyou]|uniref:WRKY domain-containing protein n=1 Tax=Citrus x changshan-huyou TaxID=2935761 RepID=A0AAP0N164_9ROSI
MAVELMMEYGNTSHFTDKVEDCAVQEAASGLESVEKLINLLSQQQQVQQNNSHQSSPSSRSSMDLENDCKAVADVAVSKFKRVISLLGRNRIGHARFRRAPVAAPCVDYQQNQEKDKNLQQQQQQEVEVIPETKVYYARPIQQIPPLPPPPRNYHQHEFSTLVVPKNGVDLERKDSATTINFSNYTSAGNSFLSSLTVTGDNDNKQQPSSSSASATFHFTNLSQQVSSAGKPPLSSPSLKRKCSSASDNLASAKSCGVSSGRCHCTKKRKSRVKRVVRVPAVSLRLSDIPPDDFSWRKYGQKPIKGSPHPRGYYKCSSVRGCPARKHVERALDDPSMLVVTYEGEHNHSLSVADTRNLILESS